MHADLSTRLDSQIATQARTNDYITRLVTGQATISLNISLPDLVDGQQRPYTSTISSIPQPPPVQEDIRDGDARTSSIHSNIQTNSVPSYSMSRGILTITDLWREWTEGLCGGHAVIDLERLWGVRWRKEEKEKKFFNRRRVIIKEIEKYATAHNISMQTAVEIAERRRSHKGRSLHWLANNKDEIFEADANIQ